MKSSQWKISVSDREFCYNFGHTYGIFKFGLFISQNQRNEFRCYNVGRTYGIVMSQCRRHDRRCSAGFQPWATHASTQTHATHTTHASNATRTSRNLYSISFQIPKNISFIKINTELHQHIDIFFSERLLLVVFFLILDIFVNGIYL